MSYSASLPPRKIIDAGLFPTPHTNPAQGGQVFAYGSSDAGEDIVGTGYFEGCGAQPYSSTGPVPYESLARNANPGMSVGDLVVNIESSNGATPGRVTWHSVIGSTLTSGGGAYDVTVSAHAST